MNWMEQLLIIGGVSLDIFATMESQGSVVAKINKTALIRISIFVCIWQAIVFYIGHFFSEFLLQKNGIAQKEQVIGTGIAIIIYAGLGIHLIVKAIRKEIINERREEDFNRRRITFGFLGTGIYTFLSGIAFGFLESKVVFSLLFIAVFSILSVITGVYTGYHFGFIQRKKVYGIGAALLWIAGADIMWKSFIR